MLVLPFTAAAAAVPMRYRLVLPLQARQTRRPRPLYVPAPESFALAALCLLDLSSTIWWVSYREATEGNPIMAYYLAHGGPVAFALVKMVLLVMPLIIAEWARQTRPRFVHAALRVGIAGYIGLYAVGVAQINQVQAGDDIDPADYGNPIIARHVPRLPAPFPSGWNPSACGHPAFSARLVQDEE